MGSDGNPGKARWYENGTASITSQYDKAVVMDEFSGPDKGYNDPDMMVIGMDGLTHTMNETHMAMWCMMNSPLMLGLDLRKVTKGDDIWKIIANKDLIALNQDELGIQAKRIYCSLDNANPDTEYITNHDRVDILEKPLSNGDIALSFINLKDEEDKEGHSVDVSTIIKYLGHKMVDSDKFENASSYKIRDLWTGEETNNSSGTFAIETIDAYDNVTIRVTPNA